MVEKGFLADFPDAVLQRVKRLIQAAVPEPAQSLQDTRGWLWVSIDNNDSRDLDQLTYAEEDRIYIAIADVDSLVKKGDPIDRYANHNTTSVYTPAKVFTMLPDRCCYDLTSLNPDVDRSAIVVELRVTPSGAYTLRNLFPSLVRNHAKLVYERVAGFLEQGQKMEGISKEVHQQLSLQDGFAQKILAHRNQQGALEFGSMELQAFMQHGVALRIQERKINRAHQLIENFMIAANVGATRYLMEWGLPQIRRIVQTPARWDRIVQLAKEKQFLLPPRPNAKALRKFLIEQRDKDPEEFNDLSLAIIKLIGRGEYIVGAPWGSKSGHFNLALHDYAHTTAPNRRYPDLIMQRLLKSKIYSHGVPYSKEELKQIAERCSEMEHQANKVERRLIKCAIAESLQPRIGETFNAMVTGASHKGVWVRLKVPPVEGRLTHGFEGLDVGDKIMVQLVRVDVRHGHIDFKKQ